MSEAEGNEQQQPTQTGESGMPDNSTILSPGSIILGRYEVLELLGKGGMGSVFHVKHLHLQSEFALKVLNQLADGTAWKRFENEAKAASRLDHPNLIKVHDSGLLPDGQPFFIMEMVNGETLSDMVKKSGHIPLLKTLKIFIQVGFALAYAHENGVIHRDLKPSNIMIAKNQAGSLISSVKVVDLGIAKLTGIDEFNQQTLTRTGEIFGSPLYMSPEQCIGIAVDNRSDLYSLGCSMYEALTGAPPIIGDNALSTMMKHQSEKPMSLREASMGIQFPTEVEELVAKLLEKDPANRYSNAQLLTQALVEIEQTLNESSDFEQKTGAVAPILASTNKAAFSIWTKENLAVLAMSVGAFILGFAVSTFTLPQSHPEETANKPDPDRVDMFTNIVASVKPKPLPKPIPKLITDTAKNVEPISRISPDGKTRVFLFPADSIGEIQVEGQEVREARGTMGVPIQSTVAFRPKATYLTSPDLLNRFAPDDLTELDLKDKVQCDPSVLTGVPRLTRLKALRIGLEVGNEAIEFIDALPNLESLAVNYTNISGEKISQLKRFKQLTALACTNIQEIKPILARLSETKIQELIVDDNRLTAADLRQIAKQKKLMMLSISGNEALNDEAFEELAPLSNLLCLFAIDCPITEKSLQTLKQLKKLRNLQISGGNQPLLIKLQKALKGVHVREQKHWSKDR